MPTYDFKCPDCGERFEVTCRISELEQQAVCPKCGERNVESVLSASFSSPPPPKY